MRDASNDFFRLSSSLVQERMKDAERLGKLALTSTGALRMSWAKRAPCRSAIRGDISARELPRG
jgi:hypothetical protein